MNDINMNLVEIETPKVLKVRITCLVKWIEDGEAKELYCDNEAKNEFDLTKRNIDLNIYDSLNQEFTFRRYSRDQIIEIIKKIVSIHSLFSKEFDGVNLYEHSESVSLENIKIKAFDGTTDDYREVYSD